ncbi:MAG: cytochrome c biogenesis protein ResB [Candidatus Aminicenantales bacterium]
MSSVKLAITLIIIIVVISILGTLIPQDRQAAEYTSRYGGLAPLLIRLQLTNLYRSIWYIALLSFFSLNIIVCTLTRLTPKLRKSIRPRLEAEAKALLAVKDNDRFKKNSGLEEMAERARQTLARRGYKVRDKAEPGRVTLLGRKKTLGWFGSDIVHLGLLVILAGAIISSLTGFRTFLKLEKGKPQPVPRAGFEVRLDKFDTEYYPDGQNVKDWKSRLTVIEGGREVRTEVIEVNRPLAHRGFRIYQNSYVQETKSPLLIFEVLESAPRERAQRVVLRPGQSAAVGKTGLTLSLLRFEPDFVRDQGGLVSSRSEELNNPAAQVALSRAGETLLSGWVFARYPEFSMTHGAQTSNGTIAFRDILPGISSDASIIEAAQDKGVPFIWVGCGLLMAGLFLAFYWPTREVRLLLEEAAGKTEVFAAAIGSKNREALASEFAGLIKDLKEQP